MTPAICISSISIANHPGDLPNVRTLLRVTVQQIEGTRLTLVALESEDGVEGKTTRLDHLVLTADIAEGLADALRTVLDRRGL